MRRNGTMFHTSAEFEIVRKIKETACQISDKPIAENKKLQEMSKTEYILPDGTRMKLGLEKFMAPEILFAPQEIGLEFPRKPILQHSLP